MSSDDSTANINEVAGETLDINEPPPKKQQKTDINHSFVLPATLLDVKLAEKKSEWVNIERSKNKKN